MSELIRAYGDDPLVLKRLQELEQGGEISVESESVITSDYTALQPSKALKPGVSPDKIELVKLQGEINTLKETVRHQEEKSDFLEKLLEQEKEEKRRMTLLLEDHSKKYDRGAEWEKTLKAMEVRISNQEKNNVEYKERAIKAMQMNRKLKQELEAERNRTFWGRVFGSRAGHGVDDPSKKQ